MAKKYKTKPVIIEAMIWDGNNTDEIVNWSCGNFGKGTTVTYGEKAITYYGVDTLEGFMKADVGDYIIKGLRGEYYPCKPDVFEKKYELIID